MKQNKWISLTSTLLNEHYGFSRKRQKYFIERRDLWEPVMYLALIITGCVTLIPLIIQLLDQMIVTFSAMGIPAMIYAYFFLICSVFGFLFGLLLLIGVFFFSKDLPILIPLPLKAREILSAKLTVVVIDQLWISFIGLLFPYIYLGVRIQGGWEYWLSGALILLTSQMIPLLLETVIILPLSRVIRFSKHRDFMLFSVMIIFVAGILFLQTVLTSKSVSGELTQEALTEFLKNPDNIVYRALSVYPPAMWAYYAVSGKGFVSMGWLALYLCVSSAGLLLVLFLAKRFYLASFFDLQERFSSKIVFSAADAQKKIDRARSPVLALLVREWRYFLRIPAFSFNGFGNVLAFPVLLILFGGMKSNIGNLGSLSDLTQMIASLNAYMLPIGTIVAVLAGGMNLLSSTMISREGIMLTELKALPVSARDIFLSKYFHVFTMSEIGAAAAVIALRLLFGIAMWEMAAVFAVSSICISFLNLIQMIIDIARPTLDWDNPQRAMKQNLNGIFSIVILFGFAGGCIGLGVLTKTFISPITMFTFLLAVGVLGNLFLWRKVENALIVLLSKD